MATIFLVPAVMIILGLVISGATLAVAAAHYIRS